MTPPPLELFRKFIRFGRGMRPLVILLNAIFFVQLIEFRHIKWEFPKCIAKNIFLWPLSLSFP